MVDYVCDWGLDTVVDDYVMASTDWGRRPAKWYAQFAGWLVEVSRQTLEVTNYIRRNWRNLDHADVRKI